MTSTARDIAEKLSINDLWQSVRYTNFRNRLGMSPNSDKLVEIRLVGFHLMFPKTPKTQFSDIGGSRYRGKTPKNNLWQLARCTNFGNCIGMSRNPDKLKEIWVVRFLLKFPITLKTCYSDFGSMRYHRKTPKKQIATIGLIQ